jgi:hypothetical protein
MYAFNQRVSPDGRKRVDLTDRYGTVVRNAYVMSGIGLPLNVPLESEIPVENYTQYPPVVVGFMRGEPSAVVLGALDNHHVSYTSETNIYSGYETLEDGFVQDSPEANEDVAEDVISMEECVLAAPRGARVILKHNGQAVIAGQGVSVQIPEGTFMRVSAGGETMGRIPLVAPLMQVFDTFMDHINALQNEVRALRTELREGSSGTGGTRMILNGYALRSVTSQTGDTFFVLAPALDPSGSQELVVTLPSVGTSDSEDMTPVDPMPLTSATLRISSAAEG